MSDAGAAPDDEPFYMEKGCWPYVHSIVPMSMIGFQIFPTEVMVIILLAAFVAMYGWESFEKLFSFLGGTYLAESAYDSLLGDVAVGGLSITNLWLIDEITHWNRGINHVTPYWLRLVAFVVVAAPSLVMGRFKDERGYALRYAAIAYGAFYVLVVGLVFYISAALADDAALAHNIVLRTSVWIGIVVALTAVAAVIEPRSSTFLQILSFETLLFLVLILLLVITRTDGSRD